MTAIVQIPLYPPYEQPFLDANGRVSRPWLSYFESLNGNVGNVLNPTTGVVTRTGDLTLNDFVLGNGGGDSKTAGFSVVPPVNGGTGSASVPTNGEIPIGNGTDYVAATLTAGTGISVTNGGGSAAIAATTGLPRTVVTLANADVLALPTTPFPLVAAQGAGTRIIPVCVVLESTFAAGAYTNVKTDGSLWAGVPTGFGEYSTNFIVNDSNVSDTHTDLTTFLSAQNSLVMLVPFANADVTDGWGNLAAVDAVTSASQNVIFHLATDNGGLGNYTGGNAANTLKVTTFYVVAA
jgi:hypothetical protein